MFSFKLGTQSLRWTFWNNTLPYLHLQWLIFAFPSSIHRNSRKVREYFANMGFWDKMGWDGLSSLKWYMNSVSGWPISRRDDVTDTQWNRIKGCFVRGGNRWPFWNQYLQILFDDFWRQKLRILVKFTKTPRISNKQTKRGSFAACLFEMPGVFVNFNKICKFCFQTSSQRLILKKNRSLLKFDKKGVHRHP